MKTPADTQQLKPLFFIILIFIAFISLGIPDGLLGVAWPHIRADFGVNIDAVGFLLIFGTAGYLISSFYTGKMIALLSISGLLSLSCALTGFSLIFYCIVPMWFLIVIAAFCLGLGAGGIDAGLNTYVASTMSDKHMHWLHAFYGVGITLGPFITTAGIIAFGSWRAGYLAVGIMQAGLAAVFFLSMKYWNGKGEQKKSSSHKKITDYNTPVLRTLTEPKVWTGIILFFLYTGAEASLGLWAYTVLTETSGVGSVAAGFIAGGFYAMFTAGRMASGFYSVKFSPSTIAKSSIGLALAGSLLLWVNINAVLSIAGLVLAGFAIAPVFPALVSGTKQRVGDSHAGNAIGMQMSAASLGYACVPAGMGILARLFTPSIIPAAISALLAIILLFMALNLRQNN